MTTPIPQSPNPDSSSLTPNPQPLTPKLKICHIITRMDWGGSPDIVRIFCEYGARRGYDITLIAGPSKYLSERTLRFFDEFKNNIIYIPSLRRNITFILDAIALVKIYLICKREKFDIVHTHTSKAGFLGRIAAHCAGIKHIIYMPHGHTFYGYFPPFISKGIIWLERMAARCTKTIVTLTNLERDDFIHYKVAGPEKITVFPSGLELDTFPSLDADAKQRKRESLGIAGLDRIVGLVSRLETVKGVEHFIDAASIICSEYNDITFVVVGEGGLRQELERRIAISSHPEKIKLLGWRKDVLEIISILDVLVQPSLNEAVGRVLLEAQAFSVPVVATRVGGIPEVVQDGITGKLIPARDTGILGNAIAELLNDTEKRTQMGTRGREWVYERFSAHAMVEALYRLYEG